MNSGFGSLLHRCYLGSSCVLDCEQSFILLWDSRARAIREWSDCMTTSSEAMRNEGTGPSEEKVKD